MLFRMRSRRLADFIEPCLSSPAEKPPCGPKWIHEIKLMATESWRGEILPVCAYSPAMVTILPLGFRSLLGR